MHVRVNTLCSYVHVHYMCHQIVSAGEAKKEALSTTGHIHAMSREACEEGKEVLPVEQKGNTTYISLHACQPMSNNV